MVTCRFQVESGKCIWANISGQGRAYELKRKTYNRTPDHAVNEA